LLYTDEFIENLPKDPKLGIYEICNHYTDKIKKLGSTNNSTGHSIEFIALMNEYLTINELNNIKQNLNKIDRYDNSIVYGFANRLKEELKKHKIKIETDDSIKKSSERFSSKLRNTFKYTLKDEEINTIQNVLNTLREMINTSEDFEDEHRRRLLKRINELQTELNKEMSTFDHFWGLVIESGVAIGKFGKEAKPFVKLLKELKEVVWGAQARAESLPDNSEDPFLLPEE